MLNLHKLLHAQAQDGTFYSEINPTDEQREFLRACRNKVRDHLREGIADATTTVLGMSTKVTPRFRTQGSWNYDTCVQACHLPPQEMDWDFGVYLPVDVWKENGPPERMAKAYFVLVEHLLSDLCDNEDWQLITDKDTCSRIQVASWAHMDVPLYAASAEEFAKVVENVRLAKAYETMIFESATADSVEVQRQTWDELEAVVLATRDGLWKHSDPNDVATWFQDRLNEAGNHARQLRRVCRYVKAWRDFHWRNGGPTSISLMIAVAREFNGVTGRDDIALQRAAEQLVAALAGNIYEAGIDEGKEDFNRLNADQRREASARAGLLAGAVERGRNLQYSSRYDAITGLRAHLGSRVPNEPDWIEIDSSNDDIRRVPATKVSKPAVGASKAG
ncbi:hypothetical protein BTHE68_40100 [Burkholderia sp. THE68]|uniref:CBASS cGAMP synthase n=1 Tax=Burkholderia sp. THE68 TaxID=758782 RepID=UPI0013163C62|nr:hypothetical protein [Burkholderia sp. THE68]BBU30276.1 hypothetical protein BTHE68_40100 [Burkholderia sp. THE68]